MNRKLSYHSKCFYNFAVIAHTLTISYALFIPLDLRDGSDEDILKRLNNKTLSDKIGAYAESRVKRLGGPQNVLIAACRNAENAAYSGKNIEECCKISGMDPWPMIRHLLITENLGVQMAGFAMTEDNVKMFLAHELGMPASDGSVYSPEGPLGSSIPHPRSYGTFQRFFGKYVREDKVCDLATGIYKCTALPASRIGLKDRGKCDTDNTKYSEINDIAYIEDEPENYVVLGIKNIAIIFPADAHAPYLGSGKYKKALFKVHVGTNRAKLN